MLLVWFAIEMRMRRGYGRLSVCLIDGQTQERMRMRQRKISLATCLMTGCLARGGLQNVDDDDDQEQTTEAACEDTVVIFDM